MNLHLPMAGDGSPSSPFLFQFHVPAKIQEVMEEEVIKVKRKGYATTLRKLLGKKASIL